MRLVDWLVSAVSYFVRAVGWLVGYLLRLVFALSQRKIRFNLTSVRVGFVVYKVARGHVFLRILPFSSPLSVPFYHGPVFIHLSTRSSYRDRGK
jgi:hypothetical protein